MKRKMMPAKPEGKMKVKDPKAFSSRDSTPKKTESDVYPPGKRPKGPMERLKNKRI